MADIFLSYVRSDAKRAKQVAEALEARGWSVWWDAALTPGMRFRDKIAEELHAARCVVVLWSKESIASDWVIDEAEDGKHRGVLVQALIEDVRPPHGFRQIQAANLIEWEGSDSGEFAALCTGIAQYAPLSPSHGQVSLIKPANASIPALGGSGSVTVFAAIGCTWSAISGVPWITLTTGTSGIGNGSVHYTVVANTDNAARSGTLTIGGLRFEVTQASGFSRATTEALLKMTRRKRL